ncbi:hypothetical protein E2562_004113 [Oryza meyeriana var. granulata]|uniref:Uncharacterized protein n=1 Tax=Oryza meyeriana var. granulata TaxID=110450 RepID=A0A6G1EV41_9ORYZ|nr:hypothetical protein E2562_004113 [Oryza meyeriana var. granulata]
MRFERGKESVGRHGIRRLVWRRGRQFLRPEVEEAPDRWASAPPVGDAERGARKRARCGKSPRARMGHGG